MSDLVQKEIDPAIMARARAQAQKISVDDSSSIMAYGAKSQKEMDTFTSIALARMLETNLSPMERTVQLFIARIRDCDVSRIGKGLLSRLFGGGSVSALREAYEKSVPAIEKSADEMTDFRVALLRDQALLERLEEKNAVLYQELAACAICGKERLEQLRSQQVPVADDISSAQYSGDVKAALDRLERRIADIEITRTASLQLDAQLNLVQRSDLRTADKLQSTLTNTLPLWRAQMMVALGLARTNDAMDLENATARVVSGQIRKEAKTIKKERDRYTKQTKNTKELDKAAAQSEALLQELAEIENSIKEQLTMREGTAS